MPLPYHKCLWKSSCPLLTSLRIKPLVSWKIPIQHQLYNNACLTEFKTLKCMEKIQTNFYWHSQEEKRPNFYIFTDTKSFYLWKFHKFQKGHAACISHCYYGFLCLKFSVLFNASHIISASFTSWSIWTWNIFYPNEKDKEPEVGVWLSKKTVKLQR